MQSAVLVAFSPQVVVKWLPHPKAGPISSSSAEWNGLFQPHRRLICSERKGEGVKLDSGRGCCGVLSNVVVGA